MAACLATVAVKQSRTEIANDNVPPVFLFIYPMW